MANRLKFRKKLSGLNNINIKHFYGFYSIHKDNLFKTNVLFINNNNIHNSMQINVTILGNCYNIKNLVLYVNIRYILL